jgi:hypothetical protein
MTRTDKTNHIGANSLKQLEKTGDGRTDRETAESGAGLPRKTWHPARMKIRTHPAARMSPC